MTRSQVEQFFISHHWTTDKWGHLHKPGTTLRATVTKNSVKICSKCSAGWVRLKSAYLCDVSLNAEGKILGLSRFGCRPSSVHRQSVNRDYQESIATKIASPEVDRWPFEPVRSAVPGAE